MQEIVGYPMYTLDEDGNIYSKYSNKVLKHVLDSGVGYYIVTLVNDGDRRNHFVHRLLAQMYIPNPENKTQVNHKDGVKTNNSLGNLEWTTPLENTNHALDMGLKDRLQTSQWKKVDQISLDTGEIVSTFESFRKAQDETGIPYPNIIKVCKGLRRHAGGFSWKYSETSETIS